MTTYLSVAMPALVLLLLLATSPTEGVRTESCPEWCQCRTVMPENHYRVDCSNRGLLEVPTNLPLSTTHLDLRGNQIVKITPDSFRGLRSLESVKLSDNWLSDIEPNSFKGLRLKELDLSRNNLVELGRDSLNGIRGREPCSVDVPCTLNLQENHLRTVESYALSWTHGVSVLLGNTSRDLVIEAYAFYGAENLTEIRIASAPSLTIEPRVFTNTNSVKRLRIEHTQVNSLRKFTFEGLRNIDEITFRDCYFTSIDEFSFSGITYRPEGPEATTGGLLNISSSYIPGLTSDSFRDTNLKNLSLVNNHIDTIEEHAFRGLHGLSLLEISNNRIGYVEADAFGGLRNIPHIKLTQNDLSVLEEQAFRETSGVQRLSLHLKPNTNFTLRSFSFSGLRDVGLLDIKGAPGSVLGFAQDAFHDLGGVEVLRISNISLPTLGEHTFRGLSKVQKIRLEYCNISKVDSKAFGEPTVSGTVTSIELIEGNNILCDCDTNKMLRDFENRFSEFSVTCYTSSSEVRVLTGDTLDWPSCRRRESGAGRLGFLGLAELLVLLLLRYMLV